MNRMSQSYTADTVYYFISPSASADKLSELGELSRKPQTRMAAIREQLQ